MQNMEWRCLPAQAYDCMTISRIDGSQTSASRRPGRENMRAKNGIIMMIAIAITDYANFLVLVVDPMPALVRERHAPA